MIYNQDHTTSKPLGVPLLSILVTCYNEELFIVDTLDNVLTAIAETKINAEVIVIDDCSTDRSVELIKNYIIIHSDRNIALKANKVNRGLAQNYVDGAFIAAGKYYRMCCGDDSESSEVLSNVFKYCGQADVIVPFQIQSEVKGKTPTRRWLSQIFTFLVNSISGYTLKYYNGMQIHLRYNVMRHHPSSYGFGFQADILTRVLDHGASYLEIPSSSVDKKGLGSSAVSLRNVLSVIHTLLEILARRIRNTLYGKPQRQDSDTLFRAP
jgi:glycosyltransferase involved in cell wall biosynthesis